MEWISVEERLPGEYGRYLTACLDEAEGLTDIHVNAFWPHGSRLGRKWSAASFYRVTHWMPIPEPPKELAKQQD